MANTIATHLPPKPATVAYYHAPSFPRPCGPSRWTADAYPPEPVTRAPRYAPNAGPSVPGDELRSGLASVPPRYASSLAGNIANLAGLACSSTHDASVSRLSRASQDSGYSGAESSATAGSVITAPPAIYQYIGPPWGMMSPAPLEGTPTHDSLASLLDVTYPSSMASQDSGYSGAGSPATAGSVITAPPAIVPPWGMMSSALAQDSLASPSDVTYTWSTTDISDSGIAEPTRWLTESQDDLQLEPTGPFTMVTGRCEEYDLDSLRAQLQAELSVTQPPVQPEVHPVVQPLVQPVVQPLVQPAVQRVVQPAVHPVHPVVHPVVHPAVQPVHPVHPVADDQPLCKLHGLGRPPRTPRGESSTLHFGCATCTKILTDFFKTQRLPTVKQKRALLKLLGMERHQLDNWFCNKRRKPPQKYPRKKARADGGSTRRRIRSD